MGFVAHVLLLQETHVGSEKPYLILRASHQKCLLSHEVHQTALLNQFFSTGQ